MKPFFSKDKYIDSTVFFSKKVEDTLAMHRTISNMNRLLVPKLNLSYIRTGSTSIAYSGLETESSSRDSYKSLVGDFFPDHSSENDAEEDTKTNTKNVYLK